MNNVAANGHSPTTTIITNPVTNKKTTYGQTVLKWQSVPGANRYKIIYEEYPFTGRDETEHNIPRQTNQKTIKGLVLKTLYKITIEVYNGNNLIGKSKPIYTYPTAVDASATRGDRIGILLVGGYLKGHAFVGHYDYVVCTNIAEDDQSTPNKNEERVMTSEEEFHIASGVNIWKSVTKEVTFNQLPDTCSDQDLEVVHSKRSPKNMIQIANKRRFDDLCNPTGLACMYLDYNRGSKPEITVAQIYLRYDITTVDDEDEAVRCSRMEQLVMHEAGHAYGLTDIAGNVPTVMSARLYDSCKPTEYDIAAIKAIYQSR